MGYSRLGSRIIKTIRKRGPSSWYEIEGGIKVFLDVTNPYTWDLIQGKDSEKNIRGIFLENIKENDTVIDVGAYIGIYSLMASKKIGPNGKVIAIEPLKETASLLRKNIQLNKASNCDILEEAVGSKPREMKLYKRNESGVMGFLDDTVDGKQMVETSEKIKVETLDNIISSRKIESVDMLKMDVEGFEYDVLLGCQESFRNNKIKKILCEIHSDYLKKKGEDENRIFDLLKKYDFEIKPIDENLSEIRKTKTIHILAVRK